MNRRSIEKAGKSIGQLQDGLDEYNCRLHFDRMHLADGKEFGQSGNLRVDSEGFREP